jgi:hypothetical protein
MASRTSPVCRDPTTALRLRSPDRLLADLNREMVAEEPDAETVFRNVLVGFAWFYDCAERLGVEPIALFETAAKDCSPRMRELAATFARRTDITLKAFGWRLSMASRTRRFSWCHPSPC